MDAIEPIDAAGPSAISGPSSSTGPSASTAPSRATEPLLRELVGAVLREERLRQGLTLARLAAASGVSMQHLSDVERGRKDPSSEVLAAITGALGLSVYEIGDRVAALRRSPAALRVLDLTAAGRQELPLPGPTAASPGAVATGPVLLSVA